MQTLTDEGKKRVEALAQQYGVSEDAVLTLARALMMGGTTMAQFSHPELGGSGQWLMGGMTMVGDMFNHGLKAKVDGLCSALSAILQNGTQIFEPAKPPSPASSTLVPPVSYQFQNTSSQNWWPSELGAPSSTGSQNELRYAYFPAARRLAIHTGQRVLLFDTLDHNIGGFGQQQGQGASLTFTSQHGVVAIENLPQINLSDHKLASTTDLDRSDTTIQATHSVQQENDVFKTLEQLKGLVEKGVLTESEFQAKKTELLARL